MKKMRVTFLEAYRQERRAFESGKAAPVVFRSKKDYNRKRQKSADRKRFAQEQ